MSIKALRDWLVIGGILCVAVYGAQKRHPAVQSDPSSLEIDPAEGEVRDGTVRKRCYLKIHQATPLFFCTIGDHFLIVVIQLYS